MLYIVSTPIGNLKDITLRAIETLTTADFIIAENPLKSLKLLNHYTIPKKPIHQFAEHNELKMLPKLVDLLRSGNGCLITDAGTPGISDPGFRLVRECLREKIKIIPIPGVSAAITALSASGLPTDRFTFMGFIPKTEKKIMDAVMIGKNNESTLVFYDSPFRIKKTAAIIANQFPDCHMVVGRELTKLYEEFIRGTAAEVAHKLDQLSTIKGEITIILSFKA